MSYKLGGTPSPQPTCSELADYLEVECLRSVEMQFSVTEAAQQLGIVDDESTPEDEEEENIESLREALMIIEDRAKLSNGYYPFSTDISSITINPNCSIFVKDIYTFLLLATRENMRDARMVGSIDGSVLFERLCAEILKKYFGAAADSFVFGTGRDSSVPLTFKQKLEDMLNRFSEKGYSIIDPVLNPKRKDGGIDIVAFIPFADQRQGHFIVFAQCKTGTSWEEKLSTLQPDILDGYITPPFPAKPSKVFLISDDYQERDWPEKVRHLQGVIFDRCRLMSFLPSKIEDDKLYSEIKEWNEGVLKRYRVKTIE